MKKLLVGVAAVLVSAGAASAADMPVKAPIPIPPVYTWTGFYVGLDSGWAWGTSSGTLTTAALTPAVPYSFSINGPIFGPFGGYQHQFSMVVVGVEADAQFGANLKGSSGPAA